MIESLDNKKVKNWTKLNNKKYRTSNYLISDDELIIKAFNNGYLDTLIYYDKPLIEFENSYEVSKPVLNKISSDSINNIGVGKFIKLNNDYKDLIIMGDHLQDPSNIGRIIYFSKLFNFDNVVLSKDSADIYNNNCIKESRGEIFTQNINIADLKEEILKLKDNGYKIYATGLSNNNYQLENIKQQDKLVFILGNEGSGVSKEIMDLCDGILKIDMANIDSLNVSMAGAIIMQYYQK